MRIKHAGKVISVDADKCVSIEIPATTGAEIISHAKNVTNLGYFDMFGFDKPSVGVPAATIHYGRMSMCFASEIVSDVDSGQDIHTVRLARALEGYDLTQGQILHALKQLWPQLGLKKSSTSSSFERAMFSWLVRRAGGDHRASFLSCRYVT